MTNSTALNAIQTARRDALVDYYTTYCITQTPLADGTALGRHVRTAEELYEYLLLDTRIGPDVMTSRVGEAISSLQLYINRCLGGIDPDVNNTAGSSMVEESKSGGFLYDWPDYNQVYSTWAGKERLQYYPSTYLSPTLRYNKTELFKKLEDSINQGRISDSRMQEAFQQYVLGFEELANLTTISGYQTGNNLTPDAVDQIYFIGRSKNAPYSYYWRSCEVTQDEQGALTVSAWSQWLKINVPTEEALDSMIRPCWFENRLHVCWISQQNVGATGTNNVQAQYSYYSNIWYLQENGTWVSSKKTLLAEKPENFAPINNTRSKSLEFRTGGQFSYEWTRNQVFSYNTKDVWEIPLGATFDYGSLGSFKVTAVTHDAAQKLINIDVECSAGANGIITVQFLDVTGSVVKTETHDTAQSKTFRMTVGGARSASVGWSNGSIGEIQKIYFAADNLPSGINYFSLTDGALKYIDSHTVAFLETRSAPSFLSALQTQGIDGLLSYNCQTQPVERGATTPIDFNGAYGLYFWELFFHSAFLIAERYLAEQNYVRAEQWHKYIFSGAGYRNTLGHLDMVNGKVRYWNVVPLQTDQAWNTSIPQTVDPDIVAMNDPMHYKMALFLSYVNTLIEHGDHCYRILQRDYLSQAKMYYIQASQMLGPRPTIQYAANWSNPTVGAQVDAIGPSAGNVDLHSSTVLAQLFRAHVRDANGDFLPPYNDSLLTYWDKLELRLFNLRHNLTLDGQPLVLPLYATPVSPTDLQQQHSAGNGAAGVALSGNPLASEYRFTVLMDRARTAVSGVIQLGSALQSALQQRDSEYMTLLLQTQQQQIAALTQELQGDNIASLSAGVAATGQALESAQARLEYYSDLYTNWISGDEALAMDLQVAVGALHAAMQIPHIIGAAVEMAPNIFGLADGGSRWGGAAHAVAFGMEAEATVLETTAKRVDVSEKYRRRREDWQMQKVTADFEVKQLTAQIESQNQQLAMAQKQQNLYAQELSNWRAQYALQSTRFTGLELFNWMAGRLASLYYQQYDNALALCLAAKAALGREIGTGNTTALFTAPMWNDLYQGLLAGEGLQLELQKMENTFLRLDQRGLEIQKTVSLNNQLTRADSSHSFSAMLSGALQGTPLAATGGITVQMLNTDKLVITLALDALSLEGAYGTTGKVGRFKNISVTLPALLGPYQDVEATLSLGTEVVALSRGLEDSGLFMVDFNDPKYLPFEGDSTHTGTLVLTFFNAGPNQAQRALVESLVDVIFQLRYTLKGH